MLRAIARLRPGITREQASAEGTAAARSVSRPPDVDRILGKGGPVQVRVRPLVEEMTRTVRPALLLLMAGVALVLFGPARTLRTCCSRADTHVSARWPCVPRSARP